MQLSRRRNMGERKVLNKYFPADFDPSKIPRRKQPKNQQIKSRMMLPMNVRCATCGNYNYRGTKYNSRKEDVVGETYLGIQIFRFYFKCTNCSAEITVKTDPQNSGYTKERGNFERRRDEELIMEKEKQKKVAELERFDVIKSLENKAVDSKRQMDIGTAVDELISFKLRQSALASTDAALEALQQRKTKERKMEELEDEALVKSAFHSKVIVRKGIHNELEEGDEDFCASLKRRKVSEEPNFNVGSNNRDIKASSSDHTKFTFKVSIAKKPPSVKKIEEGNKTCYGLQSLCQQYETDED